MIDAAKTEQTQPLESPYVYFGGKRKVAAEVWRRFGADVPNYVEPFFGGGSVLLGRPGGAGKFETVNDIDCMIANFWRAVQQWPDEVAEVTDWPANENDLHARHAWLVGRKADIRAEIEGDPLYCDARAAGWWVWGMAHWIGGGWCSGNGPWQAQANGNAPHRLVDTRVVGGKIPGSGVNRKMICLGRRRGIARKTVDAREWMLRLSARMRHVRVCCGDWSRVCGFVPTTNHGLTAVFLDPPYADTAGRDGNLYAHDSLRVAHDVREWAIAHGGDPSMRIALCGYDGEHEMPSDWECFAWKANGGMAHSGKRRNVPGRKKAGAVNRHRERIWFSPHCLRPETRKAHTNGHAARELF